MAIPLTATVTGPAQHRADYRAKLRAEAHAKMQDKIRAERIALLGPDKSFMEEASMVMQCASSAMDTSRRDREKLTADLLVILEKIRFCPAYRGPDLHTVSRAMIRSWAQQLHTIRREDTFSGDEYSEVFDFFALHEAPAQQPLAETYLPVFPC